MCEHLVPVPYPRSYTDPIFQRSSLPLQILLCISNRFSVIYFVTIVICYGIKISQLYNALHVQVPEIIIIVVFVPLEFMRISFGEFMQLSKNHVTGL